MRRNQTTRDGKNMGMGKDLKRAGEE